MWGGVFKTSGWQVFVASIDENSAFWKYWQWEAVNCIYRPKKIMKALFFISHSTAATFKLFRTNDFEAIWLYYFICSSTTWHFVAGTGRTSNYHEMQQNLTLPDSWCTICLCNEAVCKHYIAAAWSIPFVCSVKRENDFIFQILWKSCVDKLLRDARKVRSSNALLYYLWIFNHQNI